MEVTASDVKKLREKTGAGMLDCKKALVEAGGDFAKAEKLLKELGLAAAAKRSGRATNEGRVFSHLTPKSAALLELSCETDFVARNQDFIDFGNNLLELIVKNGWKPEEPQIASRVAEIIGKIKENITVRRFTVLSLGPEEIAVDYIHGEGGIGVIVTIKSPDAAVLENELVRGFAFDVALHVAAYNPMFLTKEDVDAAYLKEQEEIFTKQAEGLGKPANVLAGIVKGKINKLFSEICLMQQAFVKDDKATVAQVQERVAKEVGGKPAISGFLYYRVGEEIA